MKFNLIAILFFLSIISSCSKKDKTDVEKLGLKGSVKSISEVVFAPKWMFGKLEKGKRLGVAREITFNIDGNKIKEEFSIINSTFYRKDIYSYDSNNKKTKVKVYNSTGKLHSTYMYKYDSIGREAICDKYNKDGVWISRYIPKYNAEGHKVEYTKFRSDGSFDSKYRLLYTALNFESQWRKVNASYHINSSFYGSTYISDKVWDDQVRNTYYNSDGCIISHKITIVESANMDELEVLECDVDLYVGNGIYHYGDFIIDENDNWIKKNITVNKNYIAIVEREIKYYD